jgi:magnesium transporter
MIERITQGKVIWISLKNPTSDEVKKVMEELDLPPSLLNDLTAPIPRNYATIAEGAIKLVLDFPIVKRNTTEHPYEVKFIVTKKALLTVQYEEMGGMDRFKRQTKVAATLKRTQKSMTGANLFLSAMNHLYESAALKLDYIETKLADIEADIFNENEKEMVFQISNISKILIAFKHTLATHEEILTDALPLFNHLFKNQYKDELETIENQYQILMRKTNAHFETLMALRDTNTAMLFTKQNEVMKIFTIMAFVTFPLSLISSLFGMNTRHTPIIGLDGDFFIITGIMLTLTALFFLFFKHKKWI